MAASDFMSVAPPHGANYAAPLVGMQLGSQIASLPGQYYSGKEKQAEIAMREAFPNGIPKNPDGSPNVGAIMDIGAKSGGAQWVQPLLQMMLYGQAGGDVAGGLGGIGRSIPGDASGGGAPGPVSAAPAAGGMPQPRLSSAGADNQGETTLRTTISELAGSRDATPVISAIAREARINPDAPLTPAQVQQLTPMISQKIAALPKTTASDAGGPPFAPMMSKDGALPAGPQPDSTASIQPKPVPTQAMGPGGQPQVPPGGPPGSQPQSTPPQQIAQARQPQAPLTPPGRISHVGTPLEGVVPEGVDPQSYLSALRRGQLEAQQIAARASMAKPKAADAALKTADSLAAREKAVVDAMAEGAKLTEAQKNARGSGVGSPADYELRLAQQKDDVTRYGKQIAAIQGSAQAAGRQLHQIQLAEGIYRNPDFYSGTGEGLNLMYKKVVNALNPNSTEALPQEAFRKTMAAAVLNQVEQLKDDTAAVGGGGRIFQAQIELMEKAANNPDNTVPANRLLTEIAKRAALESKKIAAMANKYNGGHLDANFAQAVDDYYTKNPMFTEAEMNDVRLIAPPVLKSPADIGKAGLKPGDPFKTTDGRIKYVP